MEVLNINSTILSLIKDKNLQVQENFFRKESVVLSLFRFLSQIEQTIILKTLSHNEENIFLNLKKEKPAMESLKSFGIIKKMNNLYILNPIFKKTLIKALCLGRQNLFKQINSEMEIENSQEESLYIQEKWIILYNYILKNVGCNININKINPDVKRIIEKEQLIVKLDEYDENIDQQRKYRKSYGFAFLVQPIHTQINKFIQYYIQYLISEYANEKEKFNDYQILEFFCQFNFMSKNNTYTPIFEEIKLSKKVCFRILTTLDSLGLVQYNLKNDQISITDLFVNFLDPYKVFSDSYKSHLIIENDFKLYAYSKMEYLVYLLGKFRRFIY